MATEPAALLEGVGLWERYQEEGFGYKRPRRGELVNGTILLMASEGVIVDIGGKRDGFVPSSDLRYLDDDAVEQLRVGDEVPVCVQWPRNRDGDLILSISRGRALKDWQEAQRLLESGETTDAEVVDHNRGGVLVAFGRVRGFVPASHLLALPRGLSTEERHERLAGLVGEQLRLKVLEVDRRRRRLVLSHRLGQNEFQEQRREELLATLQVGDVRTGRVTALRDYGAFVDLGGADGLVHVSEVSHRRVSHPRQVLEVGQEVEVYVLRLDMERQRIGLSIKKLLPDPWEGISQRYHAGQLVETTISHVVKFGAFAELEPGIEGLIHVSQLSPEFVENPREIVSAGDRVTLRILDVDAMRQRISLSLKDAPQWIEVTPEELAEAPDASLEHEAAPSDELEYEAEESGMEPLAVEPIIEKAPEPAAEPAGEEAEVALEQQVSEPVAEAEKEPEGMDATVAQPVIEIDSETAPEPAGEETEPAPEQQASEPVEATEKEPDDLEDTVGQPVIEIAPEATLEPAGEAAEPAPEQPAAEPVRMAQGELDDDMESAAMQRLVEASEEALAQQDAGAGQHPAEEETPGNGSDPALLLAEVESVAVLTEMA